MMTSMITYTLILATGSNFFLKQPFHFTLSQEQTHSLNTGILNLFLFQVAKLIS